MNRVVRVSPEEARHVLENWNHRNRVLCHENLQRLRDSVAQRGWILTGHTVQVEGEWGSSQLINGQHRLTLIAEGTETRALLVVEHVERLDQS